VLTREKEAHSNAQHTWPTSATATTTQTTHAQHSGDSDAAAMQQQRMHVHTRGANTPCSNDCSRAKGRTWIERVAVVGLKRLPNPSVAQIFIHTPPTKAVNTQPLPTTARTKDNGQHGNTSAWERSSYKCKPCTRTHTNGLPNGRLPCCPLFVARKRKQQNKNSTSFFGPDGLKHSV
jgi:hypothetical protein